MIAWLETRLGALRATMTPGQRWTALIALLYVIAVVNFGAPSRTVVVRAQNRPQVTASPPAGMPPRPPATAPVAPYSLIPGYADAAPERPPESPAVPASEEAVAPPPRVVVAVRPAEQPGLPGRDDGTMAAAFLASASFDAPIVTLGPDLDATCEELRAAGNVVIASEGLGDLNDCLVAAGATVIAFDEAGGRSLGAAGGVLSTRRSVEATLVDLGRWAMAAGTLKGKVGLVGATAIRDDLERAASRLKRLGVNLAATAYLDDGPAGASQTNGAVLDFASAGVEVVVFATSVAQQRSWVAQYAVLVPGAHYVVSDASDGVRDEAYPAVFDGALAHTSLRIPWFGRDHGETPLQLACRQRWETVAGGPMRASEATRVFAWCQHIEIVDAGLRAAASGGSFSQLVRRLALPSPLTSDLATLAGGGWGPTADAVLVWRAACGCWTEERPFQPRGNT